MLARAEQHARNALSHDTSNLEAHLILSDVHSNQLQHDRALVEIDRALALNPSDASGHSQRGNILLWAGRIEEAVAELETAFALDPSLPPGDAFSLGLAYYVARRHDDAVRLLEREALRSPDYVYFPILLAAAYAELGRATDAKRVAETARRQFPVIDPTTFGS
jgi:adenylate cyclase